MTHETVSDSYAPRADKLTQVRSLWRHMRRLEGEGHYSAIYQAWELIRLRIRRGIGPFLYLRAGLYRRELSWKDKLAYVSGRKYYRLIHSVNPSEHDYMTSSKLETYRILTVNNIPVPPVYGVVEGVSGWIWEGGMLQSASDLVRLLDRLGIDTVCFKYVSGCRGRGFYKVRINARGDVPTATIEPGGEELPLQEFWETLRQGTRVDEYFCQGVIDQHPDIARFNPWSVNTVRTWMVRSVTGEWKLTFALLRMGVGEVAVDNMATGGISVLIDIDSGRLSLGTQPDVNRPVYSQHPVTDAQIKGTALPMWTEVKTLCQRTAELFPQYCLLAADVAFGKDGPLIVELGGTPDDMQGALGSGVYPLLRQLLKRRKGPSSFISRRS
jgi:hypothetical protein